MCLGGPKLEYVELTHLWCSGWDSQVDSTFLASLLVLGFFFFTPFCHSLFTTFSFYYFLFPPLCQPLPPFCSRHGPLLSHISSHNSSGKTSLNLTPRMWVHTSERSNNTEILQIRSCQIKWGISGAHPSLRRGQLKAARGQICMSKYTWWFRLTS